MPVTIFSLLEPVRESTDTLTAKKRNYSPNQNKYFYFEPRTGGKVRIFGFYNNKQTKKKCGESREATRWLGMCRAC